MSELLNSGETPQEFKDAIKKLIIEYHNVYCHPILQNNITFFYTDKLLLRNQTPLQFIWRDNSDVDEAIRRVNVLIEYCIKVQTDGILLLDFNGLHHRQYI